MSICCNKWYQAEIRGILFRYRRHIQKNSEKMAAVNDFEFSGSKLVSIDVKGRMVFPNEFRDGLKSQCKKKVVLTQHFSEPCLQLSSDTYWFQLMEEFKKEVAASNKAINEARESRQINEEQRLRRSRKNLEWKARIIYGSHLCDIDRMGRVLIPKDLRTLANLDEKVRVIAIKSKFEIWDQQVYANRFQRFQDNAQEDADFPSMLDQFSFD